MISADLRLAVDMKLSEGYKMWDDSGIQPPAEAERYIAAEILASVYTGSNVYELAMACQCFYLFRRLHRMVNRSPEWATLLGDFFFSRFSKYLIPLDSIPLIDAFADYLIKDVQSPQDEHEYFSFIRRLPAVLQ